MNSESIPAGICSSHRGMPGLCLLAVSFIPSPLCSAGARSLQTALPKLWLGSTTRRNWWDMGRYEGEKQLSLLLQVTSEVAAVVGMWGRTSPASVGRRPLGCRSEVAAPTVARAWWSPFSCPNQVWAYGLQSRDASSFPASEHHLLSFQTFVTNCLY